MNKWYKIIGHTHNIKMLFKLKDKKDKFFSIVKDLKKKIVTKNVIFSVV